MLRWILILCLISLPSVARAEHSITVTNAPSGTPLPTASSASAPPPVSVPPSTAPVVAPTLPAAPVAQPAPPPSPPTLSYIVLQGLNKVTGHISKLEGPVGTVLRFGNLEIVPHRCWKSAPEDSPENAALLEISELKPGEAPQQIFLGWMFSSSPGLSALEHPVYDVTVLSCEEKPEEEKTEPPAKPEKSDKKSKPAKAKKADKNPATKTPPPVE